VVCHLLLLALGHPPLNRAKAVLCALDTILLLGQHHTEAIFDLLAQLLPLVFKPLFSLLIICCLGCLELGKASSRLQ
jgi:hypothetical protein